MLFEPQDPFNFEPPKGPVEMGGCLKVMYTVFVILLALGVVIWGCWFLYDWFNRFIDKLSPTYYLKPYHKIRLLVNLFLLVKIIYLLEG